LLDHRAGRGLGAARLFGESQGRAAWKQIETYVRYFGNPQWREYRPFSELAVVQDRSSGGLLSGGILDMLSVLHKSAQLVPATRLSAGSLKSARMVLDVVGETLEPKEKKDLDAFVRSGEWWLNHRRDGGFLRWRQTRLHPPANRWIRFSRSGRPPTTRRCGRISAAHTQYGQRVIPSAGRARTQ
jgi:hypothetical protein